MCIWKYVLLFLALLWIIKYENGEGYQNNKPPKGRPNEIQFIPCHDNSSKDNLGNDNYLGNNNYKLHNHKIGTPLQGVYSTFLDTYGIRNYDEFFHSPICEEEGHDFSSIDTLEHRKIPDSQDTAEERKQIHEKEKLLDKFYIRDPHYVYHNPKHIENKILYPEEINKIFIKNHHSHDTEIMQHRMDSGLYGNDLE